MRSDDRNTLTGMIPRVAAIMGVFSDLEPVMRISEISRRTGLAKSVVSRIVADLIAVDFLEPVEHGVRVGIRMFELGELVQRSKGLRRLALAVMADLRQATGMTVQLSVLQGGDQVYVEILPGVGERPVIRSRVGGRVPAYATAGGKAVLAFSSTELIEATLAQPLVKLGPGTITDPEVLRAQLTRVREEGVAYESEESNIGVACAASPILRPDLTPLAAISVTGRAGQIDTRMLGIAVKTAALGLNRRIKSNSALNQF